MITNNLLAKVGIYAQEVRWWTEARAGNNTSLAGWCARASAELWRRLHKLGIVAELHMWVSADDGATSHVFLVVDDHVVDVTATQFHQLRDSEIVIMHKKEAEAMYHFYVTAHVFDDALELRNKQLRDKWPRDQIAYAR